MFKIYKYTPLTNRFSQLRRLRHSCEKECPPRYECQQPSEPSFYDILIDVQKKEKIPFVFRPVHHKDYRTWKNIFFFLCIPAIAFVYINSNYINPHHQKRPKFLAFEYLRIRNKEYPWDPVRTLFHNPKYNALPDGYEEEVPEEDEYDPFEPEK